MDIYSAASKAIGAVTAGLILYDAHKNGTIKGTMEAKRNISNTLVDHYVHSNQLDKVSSVDMNAKKTWFRYVLDNNIKEPIDATIGYIKGIGKSLVTDIIPASLATGALLLSKKGSITGKMCGVGLLLYGAKYMLYDVMSLGKRDYLKEEI